MMKTLLVALLLSLAVSPLPAQETGELVLEQPPFAVYSAFWPNLHHVLWAEAWARRPAARKAAGPLPEPLAGDLSAEERGAWAAALSFYDQEMADLNPLFDMGEIRKLLLAAGGDLPTSGLAPAHRQALAAAAPVYRKHWWPAHDRANRAWAAAAMPKVAALSPAVPDRLARLYGTPWFSRPVRVDVVRVNTRQGAYSATDPEPAHITVSSSDPDIQDWAAAEILFHESSHALVFPLLEAFAAELKAQGKSARDLWHVALFSLTGEVVRQALAARGVAYEPYLYKTGLFDRAWPQLKAPVEAHWQAFVNGEVPRDEAIKRIVAAIP
jgi:hypothetical protein